MPPSNSCRPWCGNRVGGDCDGDCLARVRLYSKPHALRSRERLPGIEATGFESNELQFVVGAEFRDDEVETPSLWTCLNFRHVVPGNWRDPEASLQTDIPGMKTIHAQLGRFLALVRSGDAHRSESQPGIGPQRVAWTAQDPADHHPDACQPWCRDHGDDGCRLRMTLALTVVPDAQNRVYGDHDSTGGAADLLAAQAIYTPGADGNQGYFYLGLDCWNTLSNNAEEYQRDRTASLPVKMPDLKRIHTRLGKLLAEVGTEG